MDGRTRVDEAAGTGSSVKAMHQLALMSLMSTGLQEDFSFSLCLLLCC